jgi:hypothetical protein
MIWGINNMTVGGRSSETVSPHRHEEHGQLMDSSVTDNGLVSGGSCSGRTGFLLFAFTPLMRLTVHTIQLEPRPHSSLG